MPLFQSQKQAKEYLIGRITDEATQEAVPLTEVERKMLYFSETDWTLPGILEVNAEFERDYDNDQYERKIAELVCNLQMKATAEERETWDNAVLKLCDGDHYLLVLIDGAGSSGGKSGILSKLGPWLPTAANGRVKRPKGDLLRLILAAILVSVVMVIALSIRECFR